jgi:hypothetical protein
MNSVNFLFILNLIMTAAESQHKDDDALCDESKCRSVGWGINGWWYPRFDCYADLEGPLLCADGYEGRFVNSEDKKEVVIGYDSVANINITVTQSYYTCCPNGHDKGSVANRHCSDPIRTIKDTLFIEKYNNDDNAYDGNFTPTNTINGGGTNSSMICNDDNKRKYPREMAMSAFYPVTYVCCDSFINGTTNATFIDSSSSSSDEDGVMTNDIAGVCDESKCISQAFANYSCWGGGPGTLFPFRCNDGYIGRKIDTEYPIWSHLDASSSFNLSYYTCCPPDILFELPVKRQCSDSVPSPNTGNQTCDLNSNLKYPREMKTRYVCCDSQIDVRNETETGLNYLDETECVPTCYENDMKTCIIFGNNYGQLFPMVCKDGHGIFNSPRKVHIQSVEYYGDTEDYTLYECCRTNTADGPFIKDIAFNKTVWPQLVVSSLAVLSTAVLIMGLSLSMLRESRRGGGSTRTTQQIQETSQQRRQQEQQQGGGCNSYNYYLILLAIPDLALNVFLIGLYGGYVNQSYIPDYAGHVVYAFTHDGEYIPLDYAFVFGCSTANLWMNAVVAHAVFVLLKKSHQGIRVKPPTIKKVTIQAAVVYMYGAIMFVIHFLADGKINNTVAAPIYFIFSAGIPIMYLLYVCFVILYQGLIKSLGGSLRELSLYFFRIIVVFLVVWLPAISLMVATGPVRTRDIIKFSQELYFNGVNHINELRPSLYTAGLLLCSIQAIISTGLALTKADVRKSVINLLTLSYCCHREEVQGISSRNGEHRNDQNHNDNER